VPKGRNLGLDGNPVIPLTLPEPQSSQPRHFSWLFLALCVLSAALVFEKSRSLLGYWPAASAPLVPKSVTVAVGPVQFLLPENLIATAYQRRLARSPDARFAVLRIALAWPQLSETDTRVRSPEGHAILVDLDSSPGRESLRARLEPFYRRLARGGELAGPDGLKILTLSARGSPATDLIAYDPSTANGFITRCRKNKPVGTAVCHRTISFTAGLELRYRFDQTLLPDWRLLDSAMLSRFEALQAPTAPGNPQQ